MHFKSHNQAGFLFIEVVLAILIVGLLGTTLLNLQQQSLFSITAYSARLARQYLLNNTIITLQQTKEKKEKPPKEYEFKNPETKISVETKKIQEKSVLAPLKNLNLDYLQAHWTENFLKKSENLLSITYQPPEKEKEKQQGKAP